MVLADGNVVPIESLIEKKKFLKYMHGIYIQILYKFQMLLLKIMELNQFMK